MRLLPAKVARPACLLRRQETTGRDIQIRKAIQAQPAQLYAPWEAQQRAQKEKGTCALGNCHLKNTLAAGPASVQVFLGSAPQSRL